MYKHFVASIILLILGGAGYYFHAAGIPEMIFRDISEGNNGKGYGVSAVQVFSGTYECTANTGCKNTTKLVLEEDTTVDLTSTIEGEDVNLGQGTWGAGAGGALVFVLNSSSSPAGTSIIAKKVSSFKISGFSFKKNIFPDFDNPTFTRIKDAEPQNTEDASGVQETIQE